MKANKFLLVSLGLLIQANSTVSMAYEGNWKRGDVYYRMVCTDCHKTQPCGAIGPSSRSRAEWKAYLDADRHAKGKEALRPYFSKPYRASIADRNKAAAKFADVPESELLADVHAHLMRSAKDGDAPTGCR